MTHISFGFTNSEFSTILAELNLAPAPLNFHRPANFHRPPGKSADNPMSSSASKKCCNPWQKSPKPKDGQYQIMNLMVCDWLFLGVCPLLSLFLPTEISHYTESERPFIDLPWAQSLHYKPCDNRPMFVSKKLFIRDCIFRFFWLVSAFSLY